MKKIIKYFKDNGLLRTIKRIFYRVGGKLGLIKSETFVLHQDFKNEKILQDFLPDYKVDILNKENLSDFMAIKYYEFLDPKEIINSKKSNIMVAFDGKKIIGFACYHYDTNHTIHDLGKWHLKEDEAWIGPTYVIKEYRSKGVHRLLLIKTISLLNKIGINKTYTAINRNNIPSIKSFKNVGFEIIGTINIQRFFNKIIRLDLKGNKNYKGIMDKFDNS